MAFTFISLSQGFWTIANNGIWRADANESLEL